MCVCVLCLLFFVVACFLGVCVCVLLWGCGGVGGETGCFGMLGLFYVWLFGNVGRQDKSSQKTRRKATLGRLWQFIRQPEHLDHLRQLVVISFGIEISDKGKVDIFA